MSIPNKTPNPRHKLELMDDVNGTIMKIFGCEQIFDHAAKANQSDYPWAQNIVSVGLLKRVHARWA
jgi:hypothetical protein